MGPLARGDDQVRLGQRKHAPSSRHHKRLLSHAHPPHSTFAAARRSIVPRQTKNNGVASIYLTFANPSGPRTQQRAAGCHFAFVVKEMVLVPLSLFPSPRWRGAREWDLASERSSGVHGVAALPPGHRRTGLCATGTNRQHAARCPFVVRKYRSLKAAATPARGSKGRLTSGRAGGSSLPFGPRRTRPPRHGHKSAACSPSADGAAGPEARALNPSGPRSPACQSRRGAGWSSSTAACSWRAYQYFVRLGGSGMHSIIRSAGSDRKMASPDKPHCNAGYCVVLENMPGRR